MSPKCCSSKYLFLDNLKVLNRISPGMSPSPSTSSWLRFLVSGSVKVVFESWNQYSVSGGRSSLLNWTEFRHHSTHTSPPSAHPRKTSIPTFQTWISVPWKSDQHLHCYSNSGCMHAGTNPATSGAVIVKRPWQHLVFFQLHTEIEVKFD